MFIGGLVALVALTLLLVPTIFSLALDFTK